MAYSFVEVVLEVGCFARYEKLTDGIRTRPAFSHVLLVTFSA
jgi:hypothetical protein